MATRKSPKNRPHNDMSAARAARAARRNGELAERELQAMLEVTQMLRELPVPSRKAVLDYVARHFR